MQLRKHQLELSETINRIMRGEPIRKIIAHVVPGGGKSLFALIACKLIDANLADKICWIVPRLTLAYQAELNFVDPYFMEMIGHNRTIRASTNEDDPCRGLSGFTSTYQALAVDAGKTVLMDFIRHRHILILDEFHHVEESQVWYDAIAPLYERAEFAMLLTGTLEHGDKKQIAFISYAAKGLDLFPDLRETSNTAIINYTRGDALAERAILPLKFYLSDGQATWTENNKHQSSDLSTANKKIARKALFTALSTEFSAQLIDMGVKHWIEYKANKPRSKLIIITASIGHAKKVLKKINDMGLRSRIATSDDSPDAISAIKAFKSTNLDILVGVGMFSEGFDCKPLSHIVSLTHIRSTPWIMQMVARAVRVDSLSGPYESQAGHIFAPDDIYFREIMETIQAEQLSCATKAGRRQMKLFEGEGKPKDRIEPIGSTLNGYREVLLGNNALHEPLPATPTETANSLREEIERHTRAHAVSTGRKPQNINGKIKKAFGKARQDMTIPELRKALEYVRKEWPLAHGGRGRVPTKVVRYYGGV